MDSASRDEKLESLQDVIKYRFADPMYLWEALQVAGPTSFSVVGRLDGDGNKRLALVGDSVLRTVLVEDWYKAGTTRGSAQQIISGLVSNASLQLIGFAYRLHHFIQSNPAQKGAVSRLTMAATVEAIIGAAYVDGGIQAAKGVMGAFGLVWPGLLSRLSSDLYVHRGR